ncbi:MAG: DUF1837 domain-containing protein [Bacteroidetes bacterium]|nr:DUF1837 domain-containing protein [Bacteroidota bacterium]
MLDFEILLDDLLWDIHKDPTSTLLKNERVISLINDFEDGKWRYSKFQNFVWDNIADTALSYRERQALANKGHSSLIEAAKKLRLTDLNKDQSGQGSELAEIILYGIMKNHYQALPVVPKIFYKQNSQDNAKGADSVHIVIQNDKDFSLWFGEAKFYNSIDDDRLNSIITSIENSLQLDKLQKENSIITNLSDLDEFLKDNAALHKEIKTLLSPKSSIDLIKPKLHIPILLLHECPITAKSTELTDALKNELIDFHKDRANSFFSKQINKLKDKIHKYDQIQFHIILFPVPTKQAIVDKFVENVQHYKKQ